MNQNQKREYYHVKSKYQKQVLFLTFIPCVLVILLVVGLITLVHGDLMNSVLTYSVSGLIEFIEVWRVAITTFICVIFIVILIMAFHVSSRLFGPFDRMVKELDEMIAADALKEIKVRPDDKFASELVQRINVIIKKATENNQKN